MSMKAHEITADDLERWERDGWFAVVCRICNEVMLYPKPTYKPEMFVGWECRECQRRNAHGSV